VLDDDTLICQYEFILADFKQLAICYVNMLRNYYLKLKLEDSVAVKDQKTVKLRLFN